MATAALLILFASSSASRGVVVIYDGFGDGDRDNNGVAFEETDVVGTYEPFLDEDTGVRDDNPLIYPLGTMVNGPTVADDPNDTGIRWFTTGGFGSSGMGDPASAPRIIDDSAGLLPDAAGSGVGFLNTIPTPDETQFIPALDSGLALSIEAKGRGRTTSGFFETDQDYSNGKQGTISLGPKVDDVVRVSFDFRVWMSAPNLQDPANATHHVPDYGHLRFGLFQDTDNQLGQTNDFGGFNFSSAVWGEEDGFFRGDLSGPDGTGDAGWYARLPLQDADSTAPGFAIGPDGRDARINEETNDTGISGERLMEGGDNQTVASPDQVAPDFVNLDTKKRYNLSLELRRFDEAGGSTDPADDGDNIVATLTVTDIDDPINSTWSLSGFDAFDDVNGPGFDSDSWDYFHIGVYTAGVSAQEFDMILDNFTVEVEGSNAGSAVDLNQDGNIDGRDLLLIQQSNTALTGQWEDEYGNTAAAAAVNAVPEPGTIALLGLGGLLALGARSRSRD